MIRKPWEEEWFVRFSERGGYDCMSASHDVVAQASDVGSGDHHTVVVVDHADVKGALPAEELARFIAAAPDLYRALARFAREECLCNGGIIQDSPCRHTQARAAIDRSCGPNKERDQ